MKLGMVLGRVDHVIAGQRQANRLGAVLAGDLDPTIVLAQHAARIGEVLDLRRYHLIL